MNDRGLEVKKLRKKLKLTQKEFGELFGVSLRTVQNWESSKELSDKNWLLIKSKYAEYAQSEINDVNENNHLLNTEAEAIPTNYLKVSMIPIHAQAGFLSGYGDQAYWDGMPTEIWEVDKQYKGNYVVFEVKGDSMDDNTIHSILEGDRILCREIKKELWQNKLHINKWNFVIVHKDEGIIVKRIIEHNVKTGDITCHSLNEYYEDFVVNLDDVIALYNVVDLKRNLRL
jgi:transcriptional regulator with XRE-family HTH domain